jgi:endoglucanase
MMAQASRQFEPYDAAFAARCLDTAKKSYAFLTAHPEQHRADQAGFTTGSYESDDWDDRLWAEAEYWEATGDDAPLAAFEARLQAASGEPGRPRPWRGPGRTAGFDVDFDWGNVKSLGLLTYLFSQREGRDPALVESLRTSLIAAAEEIVAASRAHGYARPLGTRYYWGCNGSVARQAVVLEAAYRLTNKADYRAVQLDALNHHPRATDWRDVAEDYRTNEIAINWNAALIYALAAQLPE